MSAELLEVKSSLSQSQQKAKQSASLVQELTAMVKEQKTRITEILKAKKETAIEFKVRPNILLKKKYIKVLDFVVLHRNRHHYHVRIHV